MNVMFVDTVHPVLQDTLEAAGVQCANYEEASIADIERDIANFNGLIIRSRFPVNKAFLAKATALQFIGRSGAGMENIDVDYCSNRGITLINAPEGNRTAVGEHAVAMLLSLMNNLHQGQLEIKSGAWDREGNRGHELSGKTVAIIGYGNTGAAFAKCLRGFDVRILAHDKYKSGFGDEWVQETSLHQICDEADVLSLHIPLTAETKYYTNNALLQSFRKPIYVINTARGKCLNTADLVENMESGKVLGACLDVFEYEQASFENLESAKLPAAYSALLQSKKVVLSPHVAGWTVESYQKLSEVLAEKITALVVKQ